MNAKMIKTTMCIDSLIVSYSNHKNVWTFFLRYRIQPVQLSFTRNQCSE